MKDTEVHLSTPKNRDCQRHFNFLHNPRFDGLMPHMLRRGLANNLLGIIVLSASSDWANAQALPPMLSELGSFQLTRLEFAGNTAFGREQLLEASLDLGLSERTSATGARNVRELLGRSVTTESLEQARVAITLLYVNAGYLNSGAILDDQPIVDGRVVMRIVEGRLDTIRIDGQKRLRDLFFRSRIKRAAKPPLNIRTLRDGLDILRQNPNVDRLNAELRPSTELGKGELQVKVSEQNTFELGLIFDNHRTPSVGAERVSAYVANGDLLGFGDSLRLQVALTEGGFDEFTVVGNGRDGDPFGRLPEVFFDYTIPISASDTTLSFGYQKTDSSIIEAELFDLDIDSKYTGYSLTCRQPLYRTPSTEVAVYVTGNVQRNETLLLGERFGFSPGAEDGRSNSTAVRLGQEYAYRDTERAVTLRSRFSFGVDAFSPTINGGGTADSQFWSWLGQAQYVRRLNDAGWQGVVRVAAQFTDQPLLAVEQITVGGSDTVRGYRENTLVRDNGVAAGFELHVPLYVNVGKKIGVQLVPFFDVGYAYDHSGNTNDDIIESMGIGLVIDFTKHFYSEIYYGKQLNDIDHQSDDLQDLGIHFQIVTRLF